MCHYKYYRLNLKCSLFKAASEKYNNNKREIASNCNMSRKENFSFFLLKEAKKCLFNAFQEQKHDIRAAAASRQQTGELGDFGRADAVSPQRTRKSGTQLSPHPGTGIIPVAATY